MAQNKSAYLRVRLTQKEKDWLLRRSDELGINQSEFARLAIQAKLIFAGDDNPDTSINQQIVLIDNQTYKQIYCELRKEGVNLNQATRALNSIARWLFANKAEINGNQIAKIINARLEGIYKNYKEASNGYEALKDRLNTIRETAILDTHTNPFAENTDDVKARLAVNAGENLAD